MLMSKKSHLNFVFRAIHGSRVSHQLGSSVFPSIPVQQFIALPQQCHCKPCSTTTFDTTKTIGERITTVDETASTADSTVDSTLAALLLKSRLKNTSLPEPIERDGLRWEQALRAEQASGDFWLDFGLKCIRRTTSLGQIILTFSKENLSSQQTILLEKNFKTGTMVQMKYSAKPSATVSGYIKDEKQDEFTVQTKDELLTRSWKGKSFKLGNLRSFNDLTFLAEREKLWPKLTGYKAMLYAYNCKQINDGGGDPAPEEWAAKEQQHFNPSQKAALMAALNPQRPIVAVHGPMGTGKTMLLANYLHILMTQKPKHYRVAVVVPPIRSMYSLIQKYVELAKEETAHFICYRQFRPQVADSITTTNPSIRQLLELTSFRRIPIDFMSKDTVDCMATVQRLGNDMYKSRVVGSKNGQIYHSYRAKAKQFRERDEIEFIRTKRIVFLLPHGSVFRKLSILGALKFDEVVFDEAGLLCEYDAWRAILCLSSRVRLFGDYCDLAKSLLTEAGYQLELDKPLMKTLNEKFGPEVNFHLDRQYTTNPAIQVSANRMFYGERAVKPANETVGKTMNLDSLLGNKKASTTAEDNNTKMGQQQQRSQLLLTDPLLFVDIAQLEGQWQEWMFKTETTVSTSWSAAQYHTLQNWGSALLTAHHIHGLLERGLPAERLAARLGSVSQQFLLTQIFAALYPKQTATEALSKTLSQSLQGRRVDVLIRTPIDPDLEFPERARRKLISYLNYLLSRPQRQFVLIGHRRWLEEERAPGYRQLLDCFLSHGRVVGPNDMLPLGSGEFEEIVAKTKEQIRLQEKVNRTGTEGEIDEVEERKLRRKLIEEVNQF